MSDVFCACKSYCATYNDETGSHDGGRFIPRSTAFRHRQDDRLSTTLDNFASRVASSILSEEPGPKLIQASDEAGIFPTPPTATLPEEVITLDGEIRDRISWTGTGRPLVFALDPVPDFDFENPLCSLHYIPNDDRHALYPSNPSNTAFIENESCLYEILATLKRDILAVDQEILDDLNDRVAVGLHRMMNHKRCEWERQQSKTRAIAKGYAVVNTGETPGTLWKYGQN